MPSTDHASVAQTHPDPAERADVFWSTGSRGRIHKGKMQFKSFPSLNDAVDFVRLQTAGSMNSLMYTIDTDDRSLEGAELNALLLAVDKR